MKNLLLEIGTEEIPAGYIEPALQGIQALLLSILAEARIAHGGARTMGTPRRLAIEVSGVASRQPPLIAEMMGPPKRIGLDMNGTPTVAAVKFAEKVGIPVDRIRIKETKKGPYLYAVKTEPGLSTRRLLASILPEVIRAVPFPKTMRWADCRVAFARPIHTIVALFGASVVSFRIEGLKSGRHTAGHCFLGPARIKIAQADTYVEMLRGAHVLVDIQERRQKVADEVARTAAALEGIVLEDPELVGTVTHLTEYPAAVAGRFDQKFLELPREILITAMREHQKYFAVADRNHALLPFFVAVNNTPAKDTALVAKGHQRVLRARLEDARFFYKADLKTPLEHWKDRLRGVLFQARLGSMLEKVLRIQHLTRYLSDVLAVDPQTTVHAQRAAGLCKVDLVSHVVGEFPKLQGTMGRIYAQAAGEPDTVAAAIEEHYRPTHSGGPLPSTTAGALLAIADKMDSICGCFGIGLLPTGASDPYALRRQGIGIVQIARDRDLPFSLGGLIGESLGRFAFPPGTQARDVSENVSRFLTHRMVQLLTDEGFGKDLVNAVVSVSADSIPDVFHRVRALSALKAAPDFEPLAVGFKRVVNILRQARQRGEQIDAGGVSEGLFEHESESALYGAYRGVRQKMQDVLKNGNYEQALRHVARLRQPVDAFFDGVMVLTEAESLRRNRLALLGRIAGLFETIADFSKIST